MDGTTETDAKMGDDIFQHANSVVNLEIESSSAENVSKKSFYENQTPPPNSKNHIFPQAYVTNLQPVNSPPDHSAWYPDSGTTHHVTNDAQTLVDLALYQGPDQLQVGNGIGLTIHSTGSSSLISRSQPLKLVNILHVPEIWKRLLSVYRLTNDNAVFVEFHATYFVVKDEETARPLL